MTINDVLNGRTLYISVICGLLFIFGICIIFFKKALDQAQVLGFSQETLKRVIKSSIIFSIVPSLSIIIALFSLSSVLGIPWSWFRLSVVGALAYELLAAEMSVTGVGYESLSDFLSKGEISAIGTIMMVMSLSIIAGIIFNLFLGKKLQKSMLTFREKHDKWGKLAFSYFPLALVVVFLPMQIMKGKVFTATLLTSALISFIHLLIIKKFKVKWLGEFILSNSLVLGMISSVFWHNIL